jgi:hypothetical protein
VPVCYRSTVSLEDEDPIMRVPLVAGLAGLVVALTPALVRAEDAPSAYPPCDKTPTEGEVEGAKGAFKAGQASFEEGDYTRAISYWEDAYRRDCTAHALLLNLARAFELNNQKQHAVTALETYLARVPSSPQRDQIARRIDVLKEKLAAEQATPGVATPTDRSVPAPKPVTVEHDKTGGGKRPLTPLIVAGAGGVITVVGGILYLGAASDVKNIEDKCRGRTCKDPALSEEGNSARTRQTTWGVVTVGGLAVAAGGVVWYFLSEPEPAPKSARASRKQHSLGGRVDPVVSRGFTGLAFTGRF